MWSKLSLVLRTVSYLKFSQIYFQVYYRIRNKIASPKISIPNSATIRSLNFEVFQDPALQGMVRLQGKKYAFQFLNQEYTTENIDWNHAEFGKLWTYNLNYFEFLLDAEVDASLGKSLIDDFIKKNNDIRDGYEPYPISLRVINWIKFLTKHPVSDDKINAHLKGQVTLLVKQIEYHLLGNHILENAFALIFAAYYFEDSGLYKKAKRLLVNELDAQIEEDGAHFELSPMYHQIMFSKVLDVYQLANSNDLFGKELVSLTSVHTQKMLNWLNTISFRSGEIPMFNDSAFGIAPSSHFLFEYAGQLGFQPQNTALTSSGYRVFDHEDVEIRVDVGNVVASYQPGHTHADTFSFELHYQGKPVIVDPAVSTYADLTYRKPERATNYHNTLNLDGKNSSEVWSSFRVASRATVSIVEDTQSRLSAKHDGYRAFGGIHQRTWELENGALTIIDELSASSGLHWQSCLHFHPSCQVTMTDKGLQVDDLLIELEGYEHIELKPYNFAVGFNKRTEAIKLFATVSEKSLIKIRKC